MKKVFKCREIPNKSFSSELEMLKDIKDNVKRIVDNKKSVIKESDGFRCLSYTKKDISIKALPDMKSDYIYPVINTTNWYDSHGDVHLPGIWNKTAKDQQGKVYYVINHDIIIGKIIAYPEDVNMMICDTTFKELGIDIEGVTQALIFETKLSDDSNQDAVKAIENKRPVQNSVRMIYMDMAVCINSNDPYFEEEKNNWDLHFPQIANKEDVLEDNYFWAILEARVYKEGSMVALGSNSATPVITSEEAKSTDPEPSDDTQNSEKKEPLDNTLDLSKLTKAFKL